MHRCRAQAERDEVRRELLPPLEAGGWAVTAAVELLWTGEFDLDRLTAHLDLGRRPDQVPASNALHCVCRHV